MIFALWSDINWYGFALFLYILMLFDELRWYKWRPLKCRGKWSEYRCSHLISILLFTFRKIVPESLYLQNCWPIAKEIPVHVLSVKSCEKVVFKHFLKFTEKHLRWILFFKRTGLQLYWKKTPMQVFSCECCNTFKSSFYLQSTF